MAAVACAPMALIVCSSAVRRVEALDALASAVAQALSASDPHRHRLGVGLCARAIADQFVAVTFCLLRRPGAFGESLEFATALVARGGFTRGGILLTVAVGRARQV